jgi:hypothetical protein
MRWIALLWLLACTNVYGAENDLSVAWIARTPRIDYVWNSSNPTVEGWPAVGAPVTWIANVRWLGDAPLHGVAYRWTIDGTEAASGKLDFAASSLVQVELPWTWTFTRHEIAFEIDTDRKVDETEERNNRVVVQSDAIGIGIYVERSFRDAMGPKIKAAGIGATTFDDWMQIQARRFNEMALYAVYPESPDGVHDRWRIDDIHLVDDGALPLAPPYSEARDWGAAPIDITTVYPNVLDHTVDVQWGFPASSISFWPETSAWILTIGNSLVHEWSHARTMIDTYAWDVLPPSDVIKFEPVPYAYYNSLQQGLMHFDWGHIDRFTAAAMNRMAGRRAVRGNYNEPWDLGWFLMDLPAQNRVRLLRPDGTPIANRKVILHRATGETVDWRAGHAYGMVFDKNGATTLTTDSQGRIEVGRNPFSDGPIFALVDKANGDVILQIEDGAIRRWAYLESLQFNLAYWSGHTDLADYDILVNDQYCSDHLGPSNVEPLPEAAVTTSDVLVHFSATPGTKYELWWATNGAAPAKLDVPIIDSGSRAEVRFRPPAGRIVWWFVEASSTPPCPQRHSSIYAFDHQVETHRRRSAAR